MFKKKNSFVAWVLLFAITVSVFSGYPPTKKAQAATFTFKTGSYVGDGTDNRTITGLGFQPDLVIIKDYNANGTDGLIMKTSSMAGEVSVPLAEAETNLAANNIQSLDSDGFTIGTDPDVNAANVMHFWVAFGGSDCSASGTFCVGTYTGTGAAQNITSVGFQPNLVIVRQDGANQGLWKSSSMAGTVSNYFSALAQLATQGITGLLANGFSVGTNAGVSTNGQTYYYVAFKEVNGFLDVGTYTGNGTDGRDIDSTVDANLDFQPDFVWVKRTTARAGVGNIRENYGDRSFIGTDGTSAPNHIQILLPTGGFDIGTSNSVNQAGGTFFYFAFGGANNHNPDSTGTYEMAEGTYTGTGAAFSITGLSFAPDLVIVKGDTAQYGVFRTKLMAGNRTAYFANAATVFTGGITALNGDGFSVGTNAAVNSGAVSYQWVAYGNASRIDKAGGAADFIIGQYIGTGNDAMNIIDLGVAPEVLTIKRVGASTAVFRTPNQTGDNTHSFGGVNLTANRIQAINVDGFQKGNNAEVNTSGNGYDFFAFTTGPRLTVGGYTGNGTSQNITTATFQPDYLWVKNVGTSAAVFRLSDTPGDFVLPFINGTSATDRITNLILNGFSIGTGPGTNTAGQDYTYVAWNAKEYTQQAFRWFANADSTDVGAALAAVNTAATISPAAPLRLRMLMRVDIGNLFTDAEEFDLQIATKSGTCDTSFTGETYADVSGSTEITFFNNPTPAHDATLTPNANDPTDGGRTITNQTYNEQNPVLPGVSSTLDGQTAKFDFALDASLASPGDYCFRMVYSDGTLLDTYTQIPEITVPNTIQQISFSLSDNSIGFGDLGSSATRWATGDTNGSGTSQIAHTLTASTNAANGYTVQLNGSTLAANGGLDTISAIGGVAAALAIGTEQFGLRMTDVGTGSVSAPYNTANYALDTAGFPDIVATAPGDDTDTTYSMIYIANIEGTTEAGSYNTTLTYTVTGNY